MEKSILENPGPCKKLWKKSGSDHIREILNPYEENLIMERNGDRRRSFSIMQSVRIDILHFYFYVHIYIHTYIRGLLYPNYLEICGYCMWATEQDRRSHIRRPAPCRGRGGAGTALDGRPKSPYAHLNIYLYNCISYLYIYINIYINISNLL